jgi:MoaA/NifB/PqqE/SkfB family radical SAM enzyme
MIKTIAINSTKQEPMMVTWDTGRRCNFDCTYCESTRHDITSPYTPLEELKQTFSFIKEWTEIYNSRRTSPVITNINFTGGEPTINPDFWKLIEHIKNDNSQYFLSLTTNGSWGKKYMQKVIDNFNGVTISYHAEADEKYKKRAIDNILELSKTDIWLQVNVMLHVDHWEETTALCNLLKENNVRYNPRPIGDGAQTRSGWFQDADGTNRRTSHTYNKEQKVWFFNHMNLPYQETENEGNTLGRTCCGGRCLQGKVDGEWQSIKLINTEFKDWKCMVDWYFLHIDQATKLVYHHQTCQATHNGRGPLGSVADKDILIDELRQRMINPTPIICPNNRCGCGMCVPKAKEDSDFNQIWKSYTLS